MSHYYSVVISVELNVFTWEIPAIREIEPYIKNVIKVLIDSYEEPPLTYANHEIVQIYKNKPTFVLAGDFNYWSFDKVTVFSQKLSEKLKHKYKNQIMCMVWDREQRDHSADSAIYYNGKQL